MLAGARGAELDLLGIDESRYAPGIICDIAQLRCEGED